MIYKDVQSYSHLQFKKFGQAADSFPTMATFVNNSLLIIHEIFFQKFSNLTKKLSS